MSPVSESRDIIRNTDCTIMHGLAFVANSIAPNFGEHVDIDSNDGGGGGDCGGNFHLD